MGRLTNPPSSQYASMQYLLLTDFYQCWAKTLWAIKSNRYIAVLLTAPSLLTDSALAGEFLSQGPQVLCEYTVHYDKATSLGSLPPCHINGDYMAKVFGWDGVKGSLLRHCFFSEHLWGGMSHRLNYRNSFKKRIVALILCGAQLPHSVNSKQLRLCNVQPLENEQQGAYAWSSLLTPFSPPVVAGLALTASSAGFNLFHQQNQKGMIASSAMDIKPRTHHMVFLFHTRGKIALKTKGRIHPWCKTIKFSGVRSSMNSTTN